MTKLYRIKPSVIESERTSWFIDCIKDHVFIKQRSCRYISTRLNLEWEIPDEWMEDVIKQKPKDSPMKAKISDANGVTVEVEIERLKQIVKEHEERDRVSPGDYVVLVENKKLSDAGRVRTFDHITPFVSIFSLVYNNTTAYGGSLPKNLHKVTQQEAETVANVLRAIRGKCGN